MKTFCTFALLQIFLIFPLLHPYTSLENDSDFSNYKIAVIGTGYVGLSLGACLAEFGNQVICCDIDQGKISALNQGHIPFFEIGLEDLINKNMQENRLFFTTDVKQSIKDSNVLFIAVGTPSDINGEADLRAVHAVAKMIGENMNTHKFIFMKSTVPLGTIRQFGNLIRHCNPMCDFDLAYTPEFLKEGSSVKDFCEPERIVIGTESEKARNVFYQILRPLVSKNIPFLFTSIESAEMIKYAANSFLAVKISFINEIANLCDQTGADVFEVSHAIGLDSRIGEKFLNPGPGYGGSCLPKDTTNLLHEAHKLDVDLKVIQAAVDANNLQTNLILQKLYKLLKQPVTDKTITILGLAFKGNIDDVRSSPSLKIIDELLKQGAHIKTYDPMAMENTKKLFPQLEYCSSSYKAAEDSDAVMLLTDWREFENIDLEKLHHSMRNAIFVDARNMIPPQKLIQAGFRYENVGRSNTGSKVNE